MSNIYEESIYNEFEPKVLKGNVIKKADAAMVGKTKISVEEDGQHGVQVILKKDENDTIKEIKFVCCCGETKSIILDYSEQ
jgi:hypothetical protein